MKTIRIRRLPTVEEQKKIEEGITYSLTEVKQLPPPTEEDREFEQLSKIPKAMDHFMLEEFLEESTREIKVSEQDFSELLLLFKEFKIPYKPIENGIEITYINKDAYELLF